MNAGILEITSSFQFRAAGNKLQLKPLTLKKKTRNEKNFFYLGRLQPAYSDLADMHAHDPHAQVAAQASYMSP